MKNLILILVLPLVGCSSVKQEPNIQNLLYEDPNPDYRHWAYKSVTTKDYTEPKEVN